MRTHAFVTLLALGSTALAQTGPGWSRLPSPSWIILNSFNSVPGNDIRQVQHTKLSNNADGRWTTSLAVGALPSFFGGDDVSVGAAIGEFDPYAGTFLLMPDGANLNSNEDDRHVTLSPDGLWAMVERPSGVYLSHRAQVGTMFPVPTPVSGFAPGGYYYPALAPYRGVMHCFYSNGTSIVAQPIDLANAKLTGSPVVVCNPIEPGASAISPTPVIGGDGDAEALFYAELVVPMSGPFTGDADPAWANDLDPATPSVVQVQRPDYQCCGGLAGGFVYFSHDIAPRWHIMHGEGAWLVGDDEVIGGMADVMTAAVHYMAPSPLVSTLFMSFAEAPPISIPGINGNFALDGTGLVQVAQFQTTSLDGIASLQFPIPNNVWLQGKSVSLQAVITDLAAGTNTLTDTAWLHMR